MNILGTYRHILHYLNLGPAVAEPKAEKQVADSDGPGAGGGYDDSVDIDSVPVETSSGTEKPSEAEKPSDGPGAGGGYDDADDVNDGPGAGGGYDSFSDNDGPGAGGGYFLHGHSTSGKAAGHLFKSWTPTGATYAGEEWFLAPKPANSNETPPQKPQEGEKK